MVTVNISIDGIKELQRRLDQLTLGDADLGRLLASLGETVVSQTRERFRKETGPDGQRWEKSARAEEEGGQTLTDKADLKNSITRRVTGKQVEIGTSKVYAAIHQLGGVIRARNAKSLFFTIGGRKVSVKSVTMPARPYLGISAADERELLAEVDDFIERLMRR